MAKLWSKGSDVNKTIEAFLAGDNSADQELVLYECMTSKAHAKMLERIGILTKKELTDILQGLDEIQLLDSKGEFVITQEDEDVHTKVENHLVKKMGETGKKVHTYRSRNDQVITDMRLYSKAKLQQLKGETISLVRTLIEFAKRHEKVPMPGYTHMQRGMLSSVGLWASAHAESLLDDIALLDSIYSIIDQSPLGSGASYGIPEKIDRQFTAKELRFAKVQNNVLYCQNSRGKFEGLVANVCSQVMITLSKISQDIVTFSTTEFGYFTLSSEVSTGSSIMPQKRNPDVAELIEGLGSIVLAHESAIKNASLGVPSGYMKRTQVTKEALMKSLSMTIASSTATIYQIGGISINEARCIAACTPEIFAVDAAYEKVAKGMPFRDAYKEVGMNLGELKDRDPKKELEKRLKNGSFYVQSLGELEKRAMKIVDSMNR